MALTGGLPGAVAALRLLGGGLLRAAPRRVGLAERLGHLAARGAPVRAPVSIRWNAYQVPYIEAAHDEDLATALGVVHAHLRLGQMEMMRRVAAGRVAEAVGPLGLSIDRTIRAMDLARAVPEIIASLAPATRFWAEGFVRGINHQAAHGPLPHELAMFGLAPEPWTLQDLFVTARLACADVSWLVFSRLLRARAGLSRRAWEQVWPRLLAGGAPPTWPVAGTAGAAEQAVAHATRGGSNSAAVGGARSGGRGAMIASDPHLSLSLPNMWLIAGMHAPGYNAVGLMLAGFPFVALGRNQRIAWGGTSLHAASSELFDATGLPVTERRKTVRVRGRPPVTLRLRETALGPIVSEGLLMRSRAPLALRWVGHAASDEMGAMLGVMRAGDWPGFRAALRGFAVPGQTMVYADAEGHIGRLTAAHLPRRRPGDPADLLARPEDAWDLADLADAAELPSLFDPPEEYVVSANDRPESGPVPVGYFFAPGHRAARLRALLAAPRVGAEELRRLQLDVCHPGALRLRDHLVRLAQGRSRRRPPRRAATLAILAAWDGGYESRSRGALVYETVIAALARGLQGPRRRASYAAVWTTRALLAEDILGTSAGRLRHPLERALEAAARQLARHRDWGGAHRVMLAHHLAAVPLLGRRYVYGRFRGAGGNDTLHKTGHGPVTGRHDVRFGSCARHISDLSDPDANRFVLLGGQDGWIGSDNFLDQVPLWRAGRHVEVPLRPETARTRFPHETVLRPAAR